MNMFSRLSRTDSQPASREMVPTKSVDGGRFPWHCVRTVTAVQKSTDLTTFLPFAFLAPQTMINGQEKIEFMFAVPDNAAFLRLELR